MSIAADATFIRRVEDHLGRLYPEAPRGALALRLLEAIGIEGGEAPERVDPLSLWSESDVLMISYGDSFLAPGESRLRTLRRFLEQHVADAISGVHILPFYPHSSDGGFAVIDYTAIDPTLGSWDDISAISERFTLMGDLVLNHVSSESEWFQQFLQGREPGVDYFIAPGLDADLDSVVRPRTHPVLTPVVTSRGERHVWCTFSRDQVDLDYSNPEVLLEVLRVIDRYLRAGMRILRLDAVAYLWKELGTSCIHLPETHEVIRLIHTLLEWREPHAVLVTETNVPNRENLTYFGNRDEAHAIYNFSLPPLIIDALLRGSANNLRMWMAGMPPAPAGCTYLNFIATHDGIGLRPAEGILSRESRDRMIATVEPQGGRVSSYGTADGPQPYELNVSLYDALAETHDGPDEWHFGRFICAHTIMLGIEGIPAFYVHSLLGTANDISAVEISGHNRDINRRRLDYEELAAELANPASRPARVLGELRRRIAIRRRQPAFHPNAAQFTLQLGASVFAFWRQSLDRDQSIFALHNVGRRPRQIPLSRLNLILTDRWHDLLGDGRVVELHGELDLGPYQSVWLTNRSH